MDEGCTASLVRLDRQRVRNFRYSNKIDRTSRVLSFPFVFSAFLLFSITISAGNLLIAQTSDSRNLKSSSSDSAISVAELRVPIKAWSYLQSAHKHFSAGRLQEASKDAERALQIDPDCAPAFAMKAFIELAAKDPRAAAEDGARAASIDPHSADAFVGLAMAYNSLEDYRRSQTAARQALSIRPDSWQARLELAKSLYGQNEFDFALGELNVLGKDFPDVHLVRGNVLMRLGRGHEGAAEFFTFLKEAPHDPRAEKIRKIIAGLTSAASF